MTDSKILTLVASCCAADAESALADVDIFPGIAMPYPASVGRSEFAMAMNVILHRGLLARVPTGAAYVADNRAARRKICFDHGALRTIDFGAGAPTGAIPGGERGFARMLEPLGYAVADIYPLDRLAMTGFAFRHADFPQHIPQFFVSALHVDRFPDDFRVAAHHVFASTRDALDDAARAALGDFAKGGDTSLDRAKAAMPAIVAAFGRHHDIPFEADYATLRRHSPEAAWIATEGNAFNHGTDRVPDVMAVAKAQRALGRAMKDKVEISGSGRVRQTAFRADSVEREFRGDDGKLITMTVPGSFYEFISRDNDPETGALDLRFDASNAQGIFKMTEAC